MSQTEPVGNTASTGTKNTQKYRWCFTFFVNDDGEPSASQLSQLISVHSKEYGFQLEEAPTTKKLHYQGWLSLKNKEYMQTVCNILPSAHIEPMKDIWKSKKYCSKEESRVAGPWDQTSIFIETIDRNHFYDWQHKCYEILMRKPNNRTIHWVYEPKGNCGKTAFCKYMAVHNGAIVFNNAPTKDIAFALPAAPRIVLFNMSRSSENRFNYNAVEAIKDGLIFSPKYEGRMKIFDSPHVMIFANFEPEYNALSIDRWCIYRI